MNIRKNLFTTFVMMCALVFSAQGMKSKRPAFIKRLILTDLPQDIFFSCIFHDHLDLDTLHTLRRINKGVNSLVSCYLFDIAQDNNYCIRVLLFPETILAKKQQENILAFFKRCKRKIIARIFEADDLIHEGCNAFVATFIQDNSEKIIKLDLELYKTDEEIERAISGCTYLKSLSLAHNYGITNKRLAGLKHLSNLESLNLHKCKKLHGKLLDTIAHFEKMRDLKIGTQNELYQMHINLNKISHLIFLENLSIVGFVNVDNLATLFLFTNLKKLSIVETILDKKAIEGVLKTNKSLPNLQSLNTAVCSQWLTDNVLLGLIKKFPNLKRLDVQDSNLTNKALDYINEHLTNLTYLNIEDATNITDEPKIEKLRKNGLEVVWTPPVSVEQMRQEAENRPNVARILLF